MTCIIENQLNARFDAEEVEDQKKAIADEAYQALIEGEDYTSDDNVTVSPECVVDEIMDKLTGDEFAELIFKMSKGDADAQKQFTELYEATALEFTETMYIKG